MTRINEQKHLRRGVTALPLDLENKVLRQAVQENRVSFPSQVPVFEKRTRPDLQRKIVAPYFVPGWAMEDIAERHCLGRQRMGQILPVWRIRAVKEGYLQAIQPGRPLFQRDRVDQTNQFVELAAGPSCVVEKASNMVPASIEREIPPNLEAQEPQPATRAISKLRGSNVEEELRAIVGIVDNQPRICSKPIKKNNDSCEQLLARAKVLCAQLEARRKPAHGREPRRIAVVLSGAKELFRRFQEHRAERSGIPSELIFGQGGKSEQLRRIPSANNSRNALPRMRQRIAAGVPAGQRESYSISPTPNTL